MIHEWRLLWIPKEEFGEQGGMPDRIESTQYVEGDGSDLMSGNEDLHPLLGKQK